MIYNFFCISWKISLQTSMGWKDFHIPWRFSSSPACERMLQQYCSRIWKIELLLITVSSNSIGKFATFYCSNSPLRAVVIKNSLVSTAPDYSPEQFYRQICLFLLLVWQESSSTPSHFSLHYCSNSPVQAVVIKNSSVSTAPCYCFEQFYQQICQFLLLV